MVVIPYMFLGLRVWRALKQQDKRELVIGKVEDHRSHLLVYLFAMLLPLFTAEIGTFREFIAVIVALVLIIFLFYSLNLHYMNIIFLLLKYRIYTVYPPKDDNPFSGRENFVIITPRTTLSEGEHIIANRITNGLYMEVRQ